MRQACYIFVLAIMLHSSAYAGSLRGVKHSVQQGVIASRAEPTLLVAYRAELEIVDSVFSPIAQLALATNGTSQLSIVPRFSVGASARLDVFEFVPYVSGRFGADLVDGFEVRGVLSVGVQRIYQDGWFYHIELGADQPLTQPNGIGGILLFGFGIVTNFDELV